MSNENQRKQLRKQPKRRVESATAVNLPQLQLPKTAKQRLRRKKTEPIRFGMATLKQIVFSSRWLSLGLLAVTIYALVDIYNEPRFYLTYIPVEGAVALSPEEIASASGLAGSHAFAADPSAAAAHIGQLPGVISSTVTLRWPNQVYIEVNEEAPVAIWFENGKEYGISQSGRLFPVLNADPTLLRIESEMTTELTSLAGVGTPTELVNQGRELPAVEGSEPDNSAAPETALAFIPREILEGAIQLRALRPTIERLYYQPSGGLSYQDGRGWRGYFGTGSQMNQKLAVYETLVSDILTKGMQPEYISVSNQDKPYYRIMGELPDTISDQS